MDFGCLGISYQEAGLDVRDRIYLTDNGKADLLDTLTALGADQCMILSTCNRCELFYFYQTQEQPQQIYNCYCAQFPNVDVQDKLFVYTGRGAMEHLFRVAAGLESLVLGEDQILGQVREALAFSQVMGHSKKELNRVVQEAITCAKMLKTQLKISEIPLSISYVGVRMLDRLCTIQGKTALVIGSGKMAALALPYLYEYGAAKVLLCSRKTAHAQALTATFPALEIVEYQARYEALNRCDLVVSATSAPHIVLSAEEVGDRSHKPLSLLDLAAPRDLDPAFAQREDCQLIDLDRLQEIVQENRRERERLAQLSQPMVEEQVDQLVHWLQASRVDGTIQSLQQKCSEISEDSYHYLEHKLNLCDREKKLLKKVLDASLLRMIREPILELKQAEGAEEQEAYQAALEKLFRL